MATQARLPRPRTEKVLKTHNVGKVFKTLNPAQKAALKSATSLKGTVPIYQVDGGFQLWGGGDSVLEWISPTKSKKTVGTKKR